MRNRRPLLAAARSTMAAALLAMVTCACQASTGGNGSPEPMGATVRARTGLEVSGAWAREARTGGTGGVYLRIRAADEADRLLGLDHAGSARAEIHRTVRDGEMRRMEALPEGLPLAAGETVTLEPGGLHVMLVDLKAALRAGEDFTLTLRFERAGDLDVPVVVRPNRP